MKISETPFDKIPKDSGDVVLISLFGAETRPDAAVSMGYAVFEPGVRVPREGMTSHEGDEFSYILSGSLTAFSGGARRTLKTGDAAFIPAGEQHCSRNDSGEPCTLVYMLVKTT
jgi:quercetin dioxygenase-like cupin family protein